MYSNFSGIVTSFGGRDLHPRTVNELIEHINSAAQTKRNVRVVGNGYSFNTLSHGNGVTRIHLSTFMNQIVHVNNNCVTVQAGMKLFDLCECLATKYGRALANIPNFGQMTIGGVIATGVHGTSGRLKRDTFTSCIVDIAFVNGIGNIVHLEAKDSITLGLLGVVYQVTLQTVPLYYVYQFAAHVNTESLQEIALLDLKQNDWVMYKFLLGSMQTSLICETFNIITKPVFDDVLQTPWIVYNAVTTIFDNTKTLGKYFFPACGLTSKLPNKEVVFIEFCKRGHYDLSHRAMMGPQLICPHAEIEWCFDLRVLDNVLKELTEVVRSCDDKFFKQPIECHVRFSPPDKAHGHGAAMTSDVKEEKWFVWVNLNVRQFLPEASQAFSHCENIFMQYGGKPHWSKCWSNSSALLDYIATKQSFFLDRLKANAAKNDPLHLFKHGIL